MSIKSLHGRGFTDTTRGIVAQIVDRASARGLYELDHTSVPALALWTLIRWERKVGLVALETMGIDLDGLAHKIDALLTVKADENPPVLSEDRKRIIWDPWPPLDQAESEARTLQHEYVGSEHLLLAIIAKSDPHFRSILEDHLVSHQRTKETLLELLEA